MFLAKKRKSPMESALRTMIDWAMVLQVESRGMMQDYSPAGYVREFCTVKLAGPRRAGHTSAIPIVGREIFGSDFIVIAPFKTQLDLISQIDPTIYSFTVQQTTKIQFFPKAIFVDNTFFLSKAQKEEVEILAGKCLTKNGAVILVFMQ